MTFAALLLVTSTLTSSGAVPAAAASGQRVAQTQARERPHQFGIGGSITASNRGAAGDVRYWFGDHLGLAVNAGWYRSYYETAGGDRASTIHASPAIIYMFGQPNYTRDVDIRPFIGGGASYLRSRRPVLVPTGDIRMSETSGTGMHAFGGVEVTFKEAEQVALSGELIYYRLPIRLSNNSIDGFNYLIAVHIYLK
jgi:hypothetical protein